MGVLFLFYNLITQEKKIHEKIFMNSNYVSKGWFIPILSTLKYSDETTEN